jgi:hypothetical protein
VIIGCVDNDGARLVMSELAAANLVPYLDIGVGIEGEAPSESMGGRVSFCLPAVPVLPAPTTWTSMRRPRTYKARDSGTSESSVGARENEPWSQL